MLKKILLSLSLLLAAIVGHTQVWLGKTEIGFTVGGMNYIGDLNNQHVYDKVSLALGGLVRYNFDERWSLRFDVDYGHIKGGDPDYLTHRNLSFRSHILEGSLRAEFNFFPFSMRDDHFLWTPFIFCGVGFFTFNPTAYYSDPLTGESGWYDLQPLCTEGQGTTLNPGNGPYTLVQLSMPFGIGAKYHPNKSFTLSVEYGFRKTWTDYLDDVSTVYVDNDELKKIMGDLAAALADRTGEVEPGTVNKAGMKRGDDSLNDWFAYFNVNMTVKLDLIFGWMLKKKCDIK